MPPGDPSQAPPPPGNPGAAHGAGLGAGSTPARPPESQESQQVPHAQPAQQAQSAQQAQRPPAAAPGPPAHVPQHPPAGDATPPADGGGSSQRGSLRRALGGLTTRGRSFLAAGVAAAVCAYALGQTDLLRVGVLLSALPLTCVLVLHRTRYRVAGSRRLSPSRVPARSEARVHLRIDNVTRLRTGMLMLQDQVPYVLGPRPRFILDRVEAGGRREVSYRVRSDLRGHYPLGPLQLRLTDPFGMCELTQSFNTHDTLTVVPPVEQLSPVRLSGERGGYGEGRQRALALAGDDDVIPRGYRQGDDLRRVHWRSTARHGELMVRREEQPQRAHCTVLLDTRQAGYSGYGPNSPFEWAVSGAASVCMHLAERGYAVRLLTDTGSLAPGPHEGFGGSGGDSADVPGLLLDALASVGHSAQPDLSPAYEALRSQTPGGREGLLVAFLGQLDQEQAAAVARLRHHTHQALAFTSGVRPGAHAGDGEPFEPPEGARGDSADGAPHEDSSVRILREAGWRVLPGGPGVSLSQLWHEASGTGAKGLR